MRGALLGRLVGIPIGIAVASAMPDPTGWMEFVSSEQVGGFVLSWAACTMAGGIIGGVARTERWRDVDVTTLSPLPDSSRAHRVVE